LILQVSKGKPELNSGLTAGRSGRNALRVLALTAMLFASLAALVCAPGPSARAEPAVVDVRLGVHPDKTRFVMELSESVDFKVFTLADPYRIVVDFPMLSWTATARPTAGGVVSGWRHGRFDARTLRLVLDATGPVRVREAFMIPPRDGRQARFVLDVEAASHADFAREMNRPHGARGGSGSGSGSGPGSGESMAASPVPPPVPSAVSTASAPAVQEVAFSPPPEPVVTAAGAIPFPPPLPPLRLRGEAALPMIVIDAGHGGPDPGAVAVTGEYEKTITLSVARELRRQLLATGRYRVALTRDDDRFIRLRDRVAAARAQKADLFVSLHADSIGSSTVRGLSVYTLSDTASDREAAMLAARENRVDAIGGIDLAVESDEVASILIDLAQRDTMNHSRRFANLLVAEMKQVVPLVPRPHRSAGFAVLTAPDIPSVLIELGYLSSPQDARLLGQAEHQKRIARGIVRGIDGFFSASLGLSRS
jgi:N-acetylmuramoyl-L-alanine amidase